jgi:hypothetical protein
MKKILFVICFIFVFALQTQAQMEAWDGQINKKYNISMSLTPTEKVGNLQSYTGEYSYTNQTNSLTLTGKINVKTGQFAFTEYNPEGKITGYFNGVRKNDTVTGTWTSFDKKRNFPFKIVKEIG